MGPPEYWAEPLYPDIPPSQILPVLLNMGKRAATWSSAKRLAVERHVPKGTAKKDLRPLKRRMKRLPEKTNYVLRRQLRRLWPTMYYYGSMFKTWRRYIVRAVYLGRYKGLAQYFGGPTAPLKSRSVLYQPLIPNYNSVWIYNEYKHILELIIQISLVEMHYCIPRYKLLGYWIIAYVSYYPYLDIQWFRINPNILALLKITLTRMLFPRHKILFYTRYLRHFRRLKSLLDKRFARRYIETWYGRWGVLRLMRTDCKYMYYTVVQGKRVFTVPDSWSLEMFYGRCRPLLYVP